MSAAESIFMLFGIGTQLALAAFFAARRWAPGRASTLGRVAYAAAGLGLPLGVWLASDGQSWRLWVGPILLSAWAAFGATLDLWRKVEWRDPIVPRLFTPFVTLYFFGQMFLWWPMWKTARIAWAVFAIVFVVNTALNLAGHLARSQAPQDAGPDTERWSDVRD